MFVQESPDNYARAQLSRLYVNDALARGFYIDHVNIILPRHRKKKRDIKNKNRNNFINRIKILLTYQESCVINGGITTPYFKLEKGARQYW